MCLRAIGHTPGNLCTYKAVSSSTKSFPLHYTLARANGAGSTTQHRQYALALASMYLAHATWFT